MPLKTCAKNLRKPKELFQSSHQNFKAFDLSTKMPPCFAIDWQFETGDTANEFVLEKKETPRRLVSGKARELCSWLHTDPKRLHTAPYATLHSGLRWSNSL